MLDMFDTVYTMTDWYDGPRFGVADFRGKPHLYESCWNNIETDAEDVFLLSEISTENLRFAIEDWEIWQRWRLAFERGEATPVTHPCLPADRDRHQELETLLSSILVLDESKAFAATAEFRYQKGDPHMEVRWTVIPFSPSMDHRKKYRYRLEEDEQESDTSPAS